jgi:hypothetical protein
MTKDNEYQPTGCSCPACAGYPHERRDWCTDRNRELTEIERQRRAQSERNSTMPDPSGSAGW